MLTFIIIYFITIGISFCFSNKIDKVSRFLGASTVSCIITTIINCVYFGIYYDDIPTITKTSTKEFGKCDSTSLSGDTLTWYLNSDIIGFTVLTDSVPIMEYNDSIIRKETIIENFDIDGLYFIKEVYPNKSKTVIINLPKKEYVIYKTLADNAKKRKDSL